MKILVTGGNGQVGHCLKEQLSNLGWQYTVLTRTELDISDANMVNAVVEKLQPDVIINAAAYTAVDKAEQDIDTAYAINRDGPAHLACAALHIGAAILHISTDYVFAGDKVGTYSENDSTDPKGVYGESKLAGEKAVIDANPKHIILRTAWVFGEHGNNFVKTMIRLGRTRDSLGIVADQEGGPTYAGDIANALITIAKHYDQNKTAPWGIYHFSGLPHTSWHGFAQQIFAEVQRTNIYTKSIPLLSAIATSDYPTPAKRPSNSKLNSNKLLQTFGITPSDWQSALKNISAYAK